MAYKNKVIHPSAISIPRWRPPVCHVVAIAQTPERDEMFQRIGVTCMIPSLSIYMFSNVHETCIMIVSTVGCIHSMYMYHLKRRILKHPCQLRKAQLTIGIPISYCHYAIWEGSSFCIFYVFHVLCLREWVCLLNILYWLGLGCTIWITTNTVVN